MMSGNSCILPIAFWEEVFSTGSCASHDVWELYIESLVNKRTWNKSQFSAGTAFFKIGQTIRLFLVVDKLIHESEVLAKQNASVRRVTDLV